jgi:hypothetical protein
MADPSAFPCGDCGQVVDARAYHPHLFCVLFRAGITDQERYLAASGWVRAAGGAPEARP